MKSEMMQAWANADPGPHPIWLTLSNGGRIHRRYMTEQGVLIELLWPQGGLTGYYSCRCVFAKDVNFTPDWVNIHKLTEVPL